MTSFVVSYDLIQPGKKYDSLIEALKTYPKWCHALKSTWILVSDRSAKDIRDHLARHIDANDKLIVIQSANVGAWSSAFSAEVKKWLVDNA